MNPKSLATLQNELRRLDDALNAWNGFGYAGLRGNSQSRQIFGMQHESQGLQSYQDTLRAIFDDAKMTVPCEEGTNSQKTVLEEKVRNKEEEIRLKKLEEETLP